MNRHVRADQDLLPLAYLPDRPPVMETDLNLSWRELAKAAIGWTLIFALGVAILFVAAAQ